MSVEFPGKDYGLKVLDPSSGAEIFNSKYPIFGSDITNKTPQIVTAKVTITNSSGLFNEPALPSIPWVQDNAWHTLTYDQVGDSGGVHARIIATIPHGQGKRPEFMATGYAHVKNTMRMRYYRLDEGSSTPTNVALSSSDGWREYDCPPRLGGASTMNPDVLGTADSTYFTFTGVPDISTDYGYVDFSNLSFSADNTNIYVKMLLRENVYWQKYHDSQYNFGWNRYRKFWSDYSGSIYYFTFYILPYKLIEEKDNIFIR